MFYVDQNYILHPLGVKVIRDNRELLPGTKEETEDIPGRHGEIYFETKLKARVLELVVGVDFEPAERKKLSRQFAKHLNPLNGIQPLTYADDPGITYYVVYAGKISLGQWLDYQEFPIPFKMHDPIVYEDEEVNEFTATSSGDSIEIQVDGATDAPPNIILTNQGGSTIGGFKISLLIPLD